MTKLLLLTNKASSGAMTDRLWELAADPYYTCEDIRYEINGGGSCTVHFGGQTYIRGWGKCSLQQMRELIGLFIMGWVGERSRLFIGIKLDEDVIYDANHRL